MNLNGNVKSRAFIVKLYKKHFPESNKETMTKPMSTLMNQINEMNFPMPNNSNNSNSSNMLATLTNMNNVNNSMMKAQSNNNLPNGYNMMGNSFDITPPNIFPLTMFASEKALLGNNNNYLNFALNPHNTMNLAS